MYLSQLLLDGLNRRASQLIADPYKLHAALMSAFPAAPETTPPGERILFRLEPPTSSAWTQVIVQSLAQPDWQPLCDRYGHTVRTHFKELALDLREGQLLRFRLRANPTVCRNGNRLGLVGEAPQRDWLERRARKCGFQTDHFVVIDEGFSRCYKKKGESEGSEGEKWHAIGFRAVRYEGRLQVLDPAALKAAIEAGIGPAKGLGCGLLSLAGT